MEVWKIYEKVHESSSNQSTDTVGSGTQAKMIQARLQLSQ